MTLPIRTELDVLFDRAILDVETYAAQIAKMVGLDDDTLYPEFVARLAARFAQDSSDIAVRNRRSAAEGGTT